MKRWNYRYSMEQPISTHIMGPHRHVAPARYKRYKLEDNQGPSPQRHHAHDPAVLGVVTLGVHGAGWLADGDHTLGAEKVFGTGGTVGDAQ